MSCSRKNNELGTGSLPVTLGSGPEWLHINVVLGRRNLANYRAFLGSYSSCGTWKGWIKSVVFRMWSMHPCWVIGRLFFFLNHVDIYTDGAKTMMGVTAGVLAQTRTVSLNSASSYSALYRQLSWLKKKRIKLSFT